VTKFISRRNIIDMTLGPFNRTVRIGSRTVGDGYPAFLIGEIGSNHNRSVATAKKMIDLAIAAGLDAVKFQHLRLEEQWAPNAWTPALKRVHRQIDASDAFFHTVFAYAKRRGIICLSTATYPNAVRSLQALRMPAFKVASPISVGSTHLIRQMAETGKPLIVSTGFCATEDVDRVMRVVTRAKNRQCIVLHCTSSYPTPPEALTLRHMDVLRKRYGCLVGFSDHSLSVTMPAVAVALGARVIEKHYTLSHKMKGPDHAFALEPEALKEMVRQVRDTEAAMRGTRTLLPVERRTRLNYVAKVVAARDIPAGTRVMLADLRFLRGKGGINEDEAETRVIGKRAARAIPAMHVLSKKDLVSSPRSL
jgi:sialic acid synthase SpsE